MHGGRRDTASEKPQGDSASDSDGGTPPPDGSRGTPLRPTLAQPAILLLCAGRDGTINSHDALAGVDRPATDSGGLPLNADGMYLHVIYKQMWHLGRWADCARETTILGVYPDARAAAEAVIKRSGKVQRFFERLEPS